MASIAAPPPTHNNTHENTHSHKRASILNQSLVTSEQDLFWCPDFDLELVMPPAKRAKMVATTWLFEELCAQVSTAQQAAAKKKMRMREERDQYEHAKSRQLAHRFPLIFESEVAHSPPPEATTTTDVARDTPVLQAKRAGERENMTKGHSMACPRISVLLCSKQTTTMSS